MKQTLLLTFVLGCFVTSCNNNSPQTSSAGKADSEINAVQCYAHSINRDTLSLRIRTQGNMVTGELEYNIYEKDRTKGIIQGKIENDILIADYTFRSEGASSVRQVAFRKKGDDFVEGYGDMEEKNGKIVFKDPKALNFSSNMLLKKGACSQ